MKTLAMALFTMTIATGCTINGKSMFGLGSKAPASSGSVASIPTDEASAPSAGGDDDGYTGPPKMDVDCMREGYEDQKSCEAGRRQKQLETFEVQLATAMQGNFADNGYEQRRCQTAYEKAIAAGFAATTKVTVSGQTGTIEALHKKYCIDALVAFQEREARKRDAEQAAWESKYRGVLKNDKFDRMKRGRSGYWIDETGKTQDARKLAAAKVWFTPLQRDGYCDSNGGPRYELHRLTFDGNHKLVKERTDSFCGEPPDRAYR